MDTKNLHQSREEIVVGRPVRAGSAVLVPVSLITANVGGTASAAGGRLGAFAGSGRTELLGVWSIDSNGRESWVPAAAEPPQGAADWADWIRVQKDLLEKIRAAVLYSGEPTGKK